MKVFRVLIKHAYVVGFCSIFFVNFSWSGIINNPNITNINALGWVALEGVSLVTNDALFDSACEYRVTTNSLTVYMPIANCRTFLTFKPSSRNRLARVNSDTKNKITMCQDGNTASQAESFDVVKIEERCPIYMEIYNKHQRSIIADMVLSTLDGQQKSEGKRHQEKK